MRSYALDLANVPKTELCTNDLDNVPFRLPLDIILIPLLGEYDLKGIHKKVIHIKTFQAPA